MWQSEERDEVREGGRASENFLQFFGELAGHRLLIFSLTWEDIKPHELELVLAFSGWGGIVLPEETHPMDQQSQSQSQRQQRMTGLSPSPFVNQTLLKLAGPLKHLPRVLQNGPQVPKVLLLYSVTPCKTTGFRDFVSSVN